VTTGGRAQSSDRLHKHNERVYVSKTHLLGCVWCTDWRCSIKSALTARIRTQSQRYNTLIHSRLRSRLYPPSSGADGPHVQHNIIQPHQHKAARRISVPPNSLNTPPQALRDEQSGPDASVLCHRCIHAVVDTVSSICAPEWTHTLLAAITQIST
jgi:hypothetical protein